MGEACYREYSISQCMQNINYVCVTMLYKYIKVKENVWKDPLKKKKRKLKKRSPIKAEDNL